MRFLDRAYPSPVPLSSMAHVHADKMQSLTDEELLAHSLKNPRAFEYLMVRHQREFLDRATHFIKNSDEAEDIVQETFVRMYRFAPSFEGTQGTFRTWSITILMNVARTHYARKAKSWQRTAQLTPEHYESLPDESQGDVIEVKDIVERALSFVPEDVQSILKLAFIEGLPYKEIAEREGTTEGAVKTRIHRAKRMLKQRIGEIE